MPTFVFLLVFLPTETKQVHMCVQVKLTQVNSELPSARIHCWWGSLHKNDIQTSADWPAMATTHQVRPHRQQYGSLVGPVHKLWEREVVHISISTFLILDWMLMSKEWEELLPFNWESEPARSKITCTLELFHFYVSRHDIIALIVVD